MKEGMPRRALQAGIFLKELDLTGIFITLEGGEGVGKSSLSKKLVGWLEKANLSVVETREPGGTVLADEIRKLFKAPPSEEELLIKTESLMVSAARAQHVSQLISPSLKSGKWVICDRYVDSTRVYQGLLGGIALNDLEWLIKFSTEGLEPELTFLLDCPVEVSAKRISKSTSGRDDASRYDQAHQSVHERLRSGFRKLAGFYPSRFYILNAEESPEKVFLQAKEEIVRRFSKRFEALSKL